MSTGFEGGASALTGVEPAPTLKTGAEPRGTQTQLDAYVDTYSDRYGDQWASEASGGPRTGSDHDTIYKTGFEGR